MESPQPQDDATRAMQVSTETGIDLWKWAQHSAARACVCEPRLSVITAPTAALAVAVVATIGPTPPRGSHCFFACLLLCCSPSSSSRRLLRDVRSTADTCLLRLVVPYTRAMAHSSKMYLTQGNRRSQATSHVTSATTAFASVPGPLILPA